MPHRIASPQYRAAHRRILREIACALIVGPGFGLALFVMPTLHGSSR